VHVTWTRSGGRDAHANNPRRVIHSPVIQSLLCAEVVLCCQSGRIGCSFEFVTVILLQLIELPLIVPTSGFVSQVILVLYFISNPDD
jgi:hypothetical protein